MNFCADYYLMNFYSCCGGDDSLCCYCCGDGDDYLRNTADGGFSRRSVGTHFVVSGLWWVGEIRKNMRDKKEFKNS